MSCENCVHFVVCEAFEKGVGIKKIHPMICAEFLDVVRIGNPVPLGIITRPGAGGGMRLILGAELKRVRENISCPQLGDDHYGSWGALRRDQRLTIARMIKTIEILDETLERVTRPPQVDVTSSERTVQTMKGILRSLPDFDSPIGVFVQRMVDDRLKQTEDAIMAEVEAVGVHVDKEELIRALNYERDQFHNGYLAGYNAGYEEAMESIVHCKNCAYANEAGSICRYGEGHYTSPMRYCSEGERRNGADNER